MKQKCGRPARNRKERPPQFLLEVLRQNQISQKTYVGRHVKKLTKNEQKFPKKLMLVDTSKNYQKMNKNSPKNLCWSRRQKINKK